MNRSVAVACVVALVFTGCQAESTDAPSETTEVLSAPVEPSSTTSSEPPRPVLHWAPCDDMECAGLTVPLDHDDPAAGTFELEIIRIAAEDVDRRIGVLLVNFGGPGIPGVIPWLPDLFSDGLLQKFDVVSWNPRGVSEGTVVECDGAPEQVLYSDPTPETTDEAAKIEAAARAWSMTCADPSADLLPHLSTVDSARDMDLIRAALDEDQINYLGFSYGTVLGSVYATLFPDRFRAMVLDGAFDPGSIATFQVQLAEALERVLTTALSECADDRNCPFHNDGDPFAAFDELMVRLDDDPLEAEGSQVGLGHALRAVHEGLTMEETWSELYRALAQARDGDGRGLADLAQPNPIELAYLGSNAAIWCVDGLAGTKPDPAEILAVAPRAGQWLVADFDLCDVWPVSPQPLPPISYEGLQPILIVGMTGDIRTPMESSRDLAERLDGSTLLIVERTAHGAYRPKHSGVAVFDTRCVTNTVDRYLIDLEAPDDESVCRHGTPSLLPPG